MKRKYRIVFIKSKIPELADYLERNQLEFVSGKVPINRVDLAFEIIEGGKGWKFISQYLDHEHTSVSISLVYSKKEKEEANWFYAHPYYRFGYPQPEDEWYEKRFTHRYFDFESGIYSDQIDNFRIKEDPTTTKDFLALHWVSELFAKKQVVQELANCNITGWTERPVIIHETGLPSKKICQIKIDKILSVDGIIHYKKRYQTTSGFTKYVRDGGEPIEYPESLLNEESDIVLSKEIFGDARVANRAILISKKFVNVIKSNTWKGLRLQPVLISEKISNR